MMDFKDYGDRFIEFLNNLSDEEFLDLLEEVNVFDYFAAFSTKSDIINFEDVALDHCEYQKNEYMKSHIVHILEIQDNYVLPEKYNRKTNPKLYRGAA